MSYVKVFALSCTFVNRRDCGGPINLWSKPNFGTIHNEGPFCHAHFCSLFPGIWTSGNRHFTPSYKRRMPWLRLNVARKTHLKSNDYFHHVFSIQENKHMVFKIHAQYTLFAKQSLESDLGSIKQYPSI